MLSVCSADLTAKARIRNAAVARFARDGFQKVNLRAIATSAGVSEALIFHHFGSKDGLRAACDEYVLNLLVGRARTAGRPTAMADLLGVYLSNPEEYRLQVQYMARAIEDDAPAAGTFVDTMVEESEAIFRAGAAEGSMRPSSDPRALAVLNLLVVLGLLTMAPPMARALGHEHFGPEVLQRMAVPALELYTRGLYTDDTLAKAAQDAWAARRAPQQEG
ncbi:TetR/AcrR family transcriptional regulator [Mycobacterium marinum]|uniref:TetR/AcrR family transcriptional regulator n=1 Tax=Mycobacterium marinum TaxID=1781 RepID=UPI000DC711C0|nr:TetR family transcriptional regulator [Mycobacterium marinum]WOR06666.1 TetR family transcriptional regulator [Mycobacterium marinum]BBC65471.1 TetR family transcriptional regulator [Mycobacterium marinum]